MAKQPPTPQQAPVPPASSLSFTQGFLLGQLSIALLIFFFIKFFIFGEPPSADDRALHLASLRRARTLAHQSTLHQRTRSNSTTQPLRHKTSRSIIRNQATSSGPSIATILAKTYYNVKGHQPESLDWFNVLVAQTIAQLRADARHDDAVLSSLTEVLNNGSKPDWIGEIRVTEIALGDEFPIFSNCRVMPAEEGFGVGVGGAGGDDGRLQARMDVDLSDVITLGIETTLVLNYPKPLVAVLPVALAVSVVRFSGTLAVSFIPSSTPPSTPFSPSTNTHSHKPQSTETPSRPSTSSSSTPSRPTSLAFTFLDDYRLDLSVRSLVGSRSRLQDVPKIAQLIESRVHAWFDERVVEPRFQQIVLPSLWPRKRNTRGGEDEENLPSTVPPPSSISLGLRDDSAIEDEAENSQTETETEADAGLGIKHSGPASRNKPANPVSAPEARMAAEGAKLRDAEIRAGERRDEESAGIRLRREHQRFGDRLHQSDGSRPTLPSRYSGEWSGQRGMPGAMPRG